LPPNEGDDKTPTIEELEHTMIAMKQPLVVGRKRKDSEKKEYETTNEQPNV